VCAEVAQYATEFIRIPLFTPRLTNIDVNPWFKQENDLQMVCFHVFSTSMFVYRRVICHPTISQDLRAMHSSDSQSNMLGSLPDKAGHFGIWVMTLRNTEPHLCIRDTVQ
jgi:hypothetical protein